jgi:hypothetical protein
VIKNTFWVLALEPYENLDSGLVSSVEPAGLFRSQALTSGVENAIKFSFADERVLTAAKLFHPNACFLEVEATYKVK